MYGKLEQMTPGLSHPDPLSSVSGLKDAPATPAFSPPRPQSTFLEGWEHPGVGPPARLGSPHTCTHREPSSLVLALVMVIWASWEAAVREAVSGALSQVGSHI